MLDLILHDLCRFLYGARHGPPYLERLDVPPIVCFTFIFVSLVVYFFVRLDRTDETEKEKKPKCLFLLPSLCFLCIGFFLFAGLSVDIGALGREKKRLEYRENTRSKDIIDNLES